MHLRALELLFVIPSDNFDIYHLFLTIAGYFQKWDSILVTITKILAVGKFETIKKQRDWKLSRILLVWVPWVLFLWVQTFCLWPECRQVGEDMKCWLTSRYFHAQEAQVRLTSRVPSLSRFHSLLIFALSMPVFAHIDFGKRNVLTSHILLKAAFALLLCSLVSIASWTLTSQTSCSYQPQISRKSLSHPSGTLAEKPLPNTIRKDIMPSFSLSGPWSVLFGVWPGRA